MWQLENRTPFAAERTFMRDRDGREILLVVVKSTFTIGAGDALPIADEQIPVAPVPLFAGDPARSSLVADGDFAPIKGKTDVLLAGHARALDDKPTIAVEVRLRIGAWEKRVVVTGDRKWKDELGGRSLTAPEPFTAMPLVYERAFGGDASEANPVGVGWSGLGVAPNLEDPNDLISSPRQRPRPMAFGPIARNWPVRRRLGGTYDDRWLRERRPLVPADFDDAFWQSAPLDQQVELDGGEDVELGGVSPAGVLRFRLPRLELVSRTRIDGRIKRRKLKLQTVIFEPDLRRVVLVHGSALPCHHTLYTLESSIVEQARAEVTA